MIIKSSVIKKFLITANDGKTFISEKNLLQKMKIDGMVDVHGSAVRTECFLA